MTDRHQARVDWLETLHVQTEASKKILAGTALVQAMGAEGIKEIAQEHSEIILAALVGLAGVVRDQQEQINSLAEDYLESLDQLDEILDKIDPKK